MIIFLSLCLICLTLWILISIDNKDLIKLKRIFKKGLSKDPLLVLTLLILFSTLLVFMSPLLLGIIIVAELLQRIKL